MADQWTNQVVTPHLHWRKSSNWMVLTRQHVNMVVDDVLVEDLWIKNCGEYAPNVHDCNQEQTPFVNQAVCRSK